jgi:hypothetical protein
MPRLFMNPRLRLMATEDLIVAVWSDAPVLEDLGPLTLLRLATQRQFPLGTGFLNVVQSGRAAHFSKEVSEATVKFTRAATLVLGSAHVILVPGLKGTAVRTFLSTVFLVARQTRPVQVFSKLDKAAEWLAPLMANGAHAWTPAAILTAYENTLTDSGTAP